MLSRLSLIHSIVMVVLNIIGLIAHHTKVSLYQEFVTCRWLVADEEKVANVHNYFLEPILICVSDDIGSQFN